MLFVGSLANPCSDIPKAVQAVYTVGGFTGV